MHSAHHQSTAVQCWTPLQPSPPVPPVMSAMSVASSGAPDHLSSPKPITYVQYIHKYVYNTAKKQLHINHVRMKTLRCIYIHVYTYTQMYIHTFNCDKLKLSSLL